MRYLLTIILILIILNQTSLIYLNIYTHSLPFGIYLRTKGLPHIDDYAATCLPSPIAQYGLKRGYLKEGQCPSGAVLVMKKIKGMPGDHFFVQNNNLRLNGHEYPLKPTDSKDRPLEIFYKEKEGYIQLGSFFLLSDYVPNSWDSRYWGPVSIAFLLKPFLTK